MYTLIFVISALISLIFNSEFSGKSFLKFLGPKQIQSLSNSELLTNLFSILFINYQII